MFYCFGLLGSYPMQIMPIFEIYEKTNLYKRMPTYSMFQPTKRLSLRTVTVLMTAFGAMKVPKFGLFINLIGAFACTALAFVLPVRMYDKLHEGEITKKWKLLHSALLAFGCIVGTISFIISCKEIVKAFNEDDGGEDAIAAIADIDITAATNSTSTSLL